MGIQVPPKVTGVTRVSVTGGVRREPVYVYASGRAFPVLSGSYCSSSRRSGACVPSGGLRQLWPGHGQHFADYFPPMKAAVYVWGAGCE